MESSGLGASPDKLMSELVTIQSMDVVLTAKYDSEIRLRVVTTPEGHVRLLLHKLNLRMPIRPKRITNVVATFASQENCAQENQSSAS